MSDSPGRRAGDGSERRGSSTTVIPSASVGVAGAMNDVTRILSAIEQGDPSPPKSSRAWLFYAVSDGGRPSP